MRRVAARGANAEMIVRRALHALGFRFRLHRRDRPGSPDIVLPRWRTVIFVHGCFWHRHPGCRRTTTAKSRAAFWQAKFESNVARDRRVTEALERDGWTEEIVWECDALDADRLGSRLRRCDRIVRDLRAGRATGDRPP
jgi:DNA mismatch endonuclease (patch repair protein)